MHTYMSLQGVCVSSRGFLFGVCLGVFVWKVSSGVGFVHPPLMSEYIHYNRKLNITFNFRFHMYEFFLKSVTSHALGPSPRSQTGTPSQAPSPLSVTHFMDGPLAFLLGEEMLLYVYKISSFPPGKAKFHVLKITSSTLGRLNFMY